MIVVVPGTLEARIASLNVIVSASPTCIRPATYRRGSWSVDRDRHRRCAVAGAVAAKLERLPAASRIPVALVASATVKLPTAVFCAPAPSVIVSVAVVVATATLASVPALGVFASVHGAVPAVYAASVSEKTAVDTVDLAVRVGVEHRHRDEDGLRRRPSAPPR